MIKLTNEFKYTRDKYETLVIYNKTTDRLIGINRSNGGHPFDCDSIKLAAVFVTEFAIQEYIDTIKPKDEWVICEYTITLKPIKQINIMVTVDKFWDTISQEIREYLSIRYYNKTRCLLNDDEIKHIAKEEVKYLKEHHK